MTTERIEAFYRDATAADVVRVMNGETVEARFRDLDSRPWDENEYLGGWVEGRWKKAGLGIWQFCQVYDPPQYWLDKPDPGEKYRLLAKFPDEDLQPGDEVRMPSEAKWRLSDLAIVGGSQQEGAWYRRRIEQPKPETKHYKLNVGDTADHPNGLRLVATELGIEVQ